MGLEALAPAESTVRIGIIHPTTTAAEVANGWRELPEVGDSSLIVTVGDLPEIDRSRTIEEQATRHLTAAGWVMPDSSTHAGQYLGEYHGDGIDAETWMTRFERTAPDHQRFFQAVRSPTAIVDTLETILADGILPGEAGFTDADLERLQGDSTALRHRCDRIADAIPTFDPDPVIDAIHRAGSVDLVHAALKEYLQTCVDSGTCTSGLLLAAGGGHDVEAEVDHLLMLSAGVPPAAAIDIALDTATEVSIAVTATRSHTDWPFDASTLARWVSMSAPHASIDVVGVIRPDRAGTSGVTGSLDSLFSEDQLTASCWTHRVEDPVAGAIDIVDRLASAGASREPDAEEPSDICVVLDSDRQARRFMRLASANEVPAARSGSIEVFRTRVAILSLAWLRIIEGINPDRGWAVVLEAAGCSPGDLEAWLERDERPTAFLGFRRELSSLEHGLAVVAAVAERYGADGRATHALLSLFNDENPPTTNDVLNQIASGIVDGPRVRLEADPARHVRVLSGRPMERYPVVVHIDAATEESTPALVYRPPLGVHQTRTIVEVDGHPIERADPRWSTLEIIRPDGFERRQQRAYTSCARATEHAIVVGTDPVIEAREVGR